MAASMLTAIASHAQVGYCQGLNFLAGMLLLVMQRDEERAFWVLVSLLDEGALQPLHEWALPRSDMDTFTRRLLTKLAHIRPHSPC